MFFVSLVTLLVSQIFLLMKTNSCYIDCIKMIWLIRICISQNFQSNDECDHTCLFNLDIISDSIPNLLETKKVQY